MICFHKTYNTIYKARLGYCECTMDDKMRCRYHSNVLIRWGQELDNGQGHGSSQ